MRKQVSLLLAFAWTLLILFLCLIKAKSIPVVPIENLDKVVHAFLHFVFTMLWFFFFKKQFAATSFHKILLFSFGLSIVFGITIELLQEFCTTTRSADVFDVLANTTGATLAVIVFFTWNKSKHKV